MEQLERRLGEQGRRFDTKMDGMSQTINVRFDTIEERFKGISQRFSGVEQRLDRIERQLDQIFKPTLPRA